VLDYGLRTNTSTEEEWFMEHNCGVYHKELLKNSSMFRQEIKFSGYPFTVHVRSARDPHLEFGKLTHNSFVLDQDPNS